MTQVLILSGESPEWEDLIRYAERCPWSAGPYLAREMREGKYSGFERVAALIADGRIAGFCNFTAQDELPPEYGFSPFIGFVYVESACRGHRYSQRMLEAVERYAADCGFKNVYLMSGEKGLYEKYGYTLIGMYPTIFGTRDMLFEKQIEKAEERS